MRRGGSQEEDALGLGGDQEVKRHSCSKDGEDQETARIGPGAVACKEEQAVKYLSIENANQETENKDERGQDANRGEPLALLLEAVYLEEIIGASMLGSPFCIIDGTWLRGLQSHRQG